MNEIKPYSKAIVLLLKKTVENNSPEWNNILIFQKDIQEYLSVIGLELVIKRDEGFAYVKQIVMDDDTTLSLVQRRQLSYEVSVILILLRQMLEEFDNNPTDMHSAERYVSTNEIKDEIHLLLPKKYNMAKFDKDLDNSIQTVVKLGFLREIKNRNNDTLYMIHRILKEKVKLDDLYLFKQKLEEYVGTR